MRPAPGPAYDELLRTGHPGWWRPVVGILLAIVGVFAVAPVVWVLPFLPYLWSHDIQITEFVDLTRPTPVNLAYLNLVLATGIPIAWLLARTLHGVRPRWLSSVRPRLRWGYLAACMGLSLVALVATVALAALLPLQDPGGEVTGELNDWNRTVRDFLLVVVLLTPLQAAAEEYLFRGYLLQAFGGLVRSRVLAVALSATLFALAHGLGQSVPIFFDRLAFGVIAAVLTLGTGGLEAAIGMHVVNNWVAFGLALAFSDMETALNPTGGTWWNIVVTVVRSLTYLALAWWVARQMGLANRADPAILEASRARV